MSRKIKSVSDRAKSFFDPYTGRGKILDQEPLPSLRIHECGTMILDESWNFRGVTSPFWRAYCNFDAGAAVRVGKKRIDLPPGRVIILPEGTVYDCVPERAIQHLWIHFSLSSFSVPGTHMEIDLDTPSKMFWANLYNMARTNCDPRRLRHTCAAALFNVLALAGDAVLLSDSPRLQKLLTWIQSFLGNPPSVDEMASHMGMARRTFLRWFQVETGATPIAFLTRIRIRESCRMLRFGDDSIDQIAEALGFANRHHFTRAFVATMHFGPAAFRKSFSFQP